MKYKITKLLIILSVVLLFYFVFIIFGVINSYLKPNILITLCCATLYLVTIFLLVKVFNKTLSNIPISAFVGKHHILAILVSIVFIVFSFFLSTIAVIQFNFSFQPIDKFFESSFEFIIVSISEEFVFRAFLFLSILYLLRNVLFSALFASLVFTTIHFYAIDNITHFLWIYSTSMLLTYLYVYTKSIAAPITFHFLINILNENIIAQINNDHLLIVGQIICMISCIFILVFLSRAKINSDHIGNFKYIY